MALTPAQKQARYRANLSATHTAITVYLPRPVAAQVASECVKLGIGLSGYIELAVTQFAANSDVARHLVTAKPSKPKSGNKR